MHGSRTRTSVVLTLLVGAATLVALALPEGIGGRDSVVRLTRGGLHRLGCPDTSAYGHDDPEAYLDGPADSHAGVTRLEGPGPLAAIVPAAPAAVFAPEWQTAAPPGGAADRFHPTPPAFAVSGRAPPTL